MQQPPGQPPQWQPPPPSGYGPPGAPPGAPPPSYGYPQGYPQGYPAPPQPPPKKGMSGARIAFNIIGGVIVLVGLIFGILIYFGSQSQPNAGNGAGGGGGGGGFFNNPIAAIQSSQTLVDEDVSVSAHDKWIEQFSLNAPTNVQVTTEGKKHTNDGFVVHVLDATNCSTVQSGGQPSQVASAFESNAVSVTNTGMLPAGQFCLVVQNTNIINTMVVHVKLVLNPK